MTSWYLMPQVEYYAGRYFTHDGVDYIPGQHMDQAKARKFPNLEGVIRTRYLIPIAQDRHIIPRHMWGEAQAFETVLRKHQEKANSLNLPGLDTTFTSSSEPDPNEQYLYDPAAHTVSEVLAYVDENPDETQRVLDAEQGGKNRSTLVSELEERLTAPEEE